MEQRHRETIQKNFVTLVEQTDLDLVIPLLYEKGVFSELMIEPYKDTTKDLRTRKRTLYREIVRRGPHAYQHLIDTLNETGHWDLIKCLEPNHILHPREPTISLREKAPSTSNSVPTQIYPMVDFEQNILPVNDAKDRIKVITSTELTENTSGLLCYATKSRKRGILFMITNIEFDNDCEAYRRGADVDTNNLKELFMQIGFHRTLIYNNLSFLEMTSTVENFSKLDALKETECVFIVIASHGYERKDTGDTDIRCSDGRLISSNFIIRQFNNNNCPLLRMKPKVFIFQTCRGNKIDSGVWLNRNEEYLRNNYVETDGQQSNSIRTYSDILIAHSTIPGFASHRDPKDGSWYIQALCKIFAQHAYNTHVEDLFKLVDAELQNYFNISAQTSSVENWGFNKHLYLHPGLFVD